VSRSASADDSGEINGPPVPYSFAYDTDDEAGTTTRREESGDASGTVTGSYSYTDAEGVFRRVEYTADANGYRATVKTNEPGTGKNEEIGDPADTTWDIEQPPAGLVERYTNAASLSTVSAPAPRAAVRTSNIQTSTIRTSSVAPQQAYKLVPVAAGEPGSFSLGSAGGGLGGLGGNIVLLSGGGNGFGIRK